MNGFDWRPGGGIAIAMTLAAAIACAQDYPAKPVRLVVGFPPGGSNDIVARHLAPSSVKCWACRPSSRTGLARMPSSGPNM